MTTRLLLVGGFLGAGKTTLLLKAAQYLTNQGYRVGVITNDQAEDLVDTAMVRQYDIPVLEVAGGCFCCRFPDLLASAERLQESVHPGRTRWKLYRSHLDYSPPPSRLLSRAISGSSTHSLGRSVS